jgi:phage tail sheath protein FI
MALYQQSADVRIREIDLSSSLVSASSSEAAIILISKKGRTSVYQITNAQDFITEYGTPDASVSFGHYAALDFLKEGTSLRVLRVVNTDALYSAALLKDNGTGTTSIAAISGGISNPSSINWASYVSGAEIPMLMFVPKSGPGSYGNSIAIQVTSQNLTTPAAPSLSSTSTGGHLANGTYQYRVSAISAVGDTLASSLTTITIGGVTSAGTVTITLTPVTGARGYKIWGRTSGGEGLVATVGATTTVYVDDGSIAPDTTKAPITSQANLPTPDPTFNVAIYDMSVNTSTPQEQFTCTLLDSVDSNGVQQEATQRINGFSAYVNVYSYAKQIVGTVPTLRNTSQVSLAGGSSGTAPLNSQIALAWTNTFGDPELYPSNLLINGGYTDPNVQASMISVAETRGDAVALLDVPYASQASQDFITYRQLTLNANSSYGALYGPWVLTADNYNGKQLYTPPSGWAAAICARTDRLVGPQGAPAGLNRGIINVSGLFQKYNQQQRTDLFNAQCNYIRQFLSEGISVFEQVTLQAKQSALSWVNVRRMINVIKVAVRQFLYYSLQEPNDDFLRRQIVSSVTDYLNAWVAARGISAFTVISDDSNNPPAQYNLGILKVTIIVTPVIAVHEIQVDMVISKAGVSFSEINITNLS